jgi:hypothetical protein
MVMGFLSMQAGRDPTLMTRASRGRGSPQAAAADARRPGPPGRGTRPGGSQRRSDAGLGLTGTGACSPDTGLLPAERLAGMTWLPAKRLRVLQIIRFCVIEMESTEID